MTCERCQETLHHEAHYCHHCGRPVGVLSMSAGATLLAVGVAAVSLPALAFGGCLTVFGQVLVGVPILGLGLGGVYWVWRLAR